jgi:1,4-alpha-glucan branching enzyme
MKVKGVEGTYFAVWAPNAVKVSVAGDFNHWNNRSHFLSPREQSGIWEGFIPGAGKGAAYKYHIISHTNSYEVDKADPLAFYAEIPPRTASIIWDLDYTWSDQEWMAKRHTSNSLNAPVSIYEVQLSSWMRVLGKQPASHTGACP